MKKAIYIITLLIIMVGFQAQAAKPIPSYDVPIKDQANFQEKPSSKKDGNSGMKNKRDLDVRSTVPPGHMPIIYVWVYSLDGRDVLGPFTMVGNDFLSVEIDDREWGTVVQCDEKVYISVWIEAGGSAQNYPSESPLQKYQMKDRMNDMYLTLVPSSDKDQGIRNRISYFFNRG